MPRYRQGPCSLFDMPSQRVTGSQDVYLYYFLLRYPGRTLVFLSSIDGIRRLSSLLELLGLPTFPLHSQLEQRQRLKNLDRYVPRRCLVLSVVNIASASSHMHTLSCSRLILLPVGSTSHWYLMSFIIKFRGLSTRTSTAMGVQHERNGVGLVYWCAHRTSDASYVRCSEASVVVGTVYYHLRSVLMND